MRTETTYQIELRSNPSDPNDKGHVLFSGIASLETARTQMLQLAKEKTEHLREYLVVKQTSQYHTVDGTLGRLEFASATPRTSKKAK